MNTILVLVFKYSDIPIKVICTRTADVKFLFSTKKKFSLKKELAALEHNHLFHRAL
jgi:hypothetical protein